MIAGAFGAGVRLLSRDSRGDRGTPDRPDTWNMGRGPPLPGPVWLPNRGSAGRVRLLPSHLRLPRK